MNAYLTKIRKEMVPTDNIPLRDLQKIVQHQQYNFLASHGSNPYLGNEVNAQAGPSTGARITGPERYQLNQFNAAHSEQRQNQWNCRLAGAGRLQQLPALEDSIRQQMIAEHREAKLQAERAVQEQYAREGVQVGLLRTGRMKEIRKQTMHEMQQQVRDRCDAAVKMVAEEEAHVGSAAVVADAERKEDRLEILERALNRLHFKVFFSRLR